VDPFYKSLQEIKESQIRMESDIKYHIKRTDLLEADIEKRYNILEHEIDGIERAVTAISRPMSFSEIMKIAATVASVVTCALVLVKYFKGM